jgi:tryptophan synthase alpha subunit
VFILQELGSMLRSCGLDETPSTALPLAVGFGISLPTHVTVLGGIADAAVVGSALVAEIEKSATAEQAGNAVAQLIRTLKKAALEGVSRRSNS